MIVAANTHNAITREQVADWVLDLTADAEHAERQAETGPFFPDVTPGSLRAYAAECRRRSAGASRATLRGFIYGGTKPG